jgi:hypothetical protein
VANQRLTRRIIFWSLILTAILIVCIMSGMTAIYQSLTQRAQATSIAIPTITAEALEAIYQKGLAEMNIGRWQEAKREFDVVFEVDPNYKDIQVKLREVETKLTELNQTPMTSPTQEAIVSPTQDVIAYYPFESNANDESGNHNQSIVHGVTYTREGKRGGCYQFDGENDLISTGLYLSPHDYEELSMMAWVKPITPFNNWRAILSADDGGYDRGFGARVDEYEVQVGDKGWRPGVVMDIGQWQYVGVVYEKGQISFYKDGVQYKYGDGGNFGESEQPLLIGADFACGECFFRGFIDEVMIFRRALSAEEVKQLYQSQR